MDMEAMGIMGITEKEFLDKMVALAKAGADEM